MTSTIICCIPCCKTNSTFKHSSFFQIKPEWRKLIVGYIERRQKSKNCHPHQIQLQTICGRHLNLCGIRLGTPEETWVHFPYLKVSVCRKKPSGQVNLARTSEVTPTKTHQNNILMADEFNLGSEVTTASIAEPSICLSGGKPSINPTTVEEHRDHTYALTLQSALLLKDNFDGLQTENQNLKNTLKDLSEKYEKEIQRLQDVTNGLITASIKTQSRVITPFANLLDSERMLKFYTGFSSRTSFEDFARKFKPPYDLAMARAKKGNARGPRKEFEYEQQLIMVLSRLRLGLMQHDLAYRFNVSVSIVSQVWSFWLNLLSVQLVEESLKLNRGSEHGPKNRIVLECLETFVDNSSLNQEQGAKSGGNKSYSRPKGVIEVSANGFISFVSDLYPGNLEEWEMLEQCKFSKDCGDFSIGYAIGRKEHVDKTGRYTALQTHIKRNLGFIKGFKILKGVFPNALHSPAQLNCFWKICCHLINFINGPLMEK